MENTNLKTELLTGSIAGLCMGVGLGIYSTIERNWPAKRKKLYGWFEKKEDAEGALAKAQEIIDKIGKLSEEHMTEIVRYYPDVTLDLYPWTGYATRSEMVWRSTAKFKIVKDEKSGRYLIKAPRPKME